MLRKIAGLVLLAALVGCEEAPPTEPAPRWTTPFSAVRWDGETPVVRIDDEWLVLQSLDGQPVAKIVGFIQDETGELYRKRFSEDLVKMLTVMGHRPNVSVTLVLEKDGRVTERTVLMSRDNRRRAVEYNRRAAAAQWTPRPTMPPTPTPEPLVDQVAKWIDAVWDGEPAPGTANLRILMKKGGVAFAGKRSLQGLFRFQAIGARTHTQSFNPNRKGRWVYHALAPGTYDLSVVGLDELAGFAWARKGVEVVAGASLLFEMETTAFTGPPAPRAALVKDRAIGHSPDRADQ